MYINNEQLRKFLSDSGLVSAKNFDFSLEKSKTSKQEVGDILVSDGFIKEDDLRRTYAYMLGIPFINLTGTVIDFATLSLIPEPIARRNNVVSFREDGGNLEVAMLNTDDLAAIDFIKKKTHLKILPRLTDVASIKFALRQYQKSLKEELSQIVEKETKNLVGTDEKNVERLAEGIPAVRIVDALLRHAIAQNASDIHLEPHTSSFVARYRIDGVLHDIIALPQYAAPSITARIKVLSGLRLDEKRLPQDGRFRMETGGDKVSFRVSLLPTHYGEKIVMRILREDVAGLTLEALGFHGVALERAHESLKRTTGLILITGPTGSGKSTTLYTMLDILNTPDVNISTIEDPIEYQMPRVNQSQVKPEIGFTFSNGLRALVRQDPDIIMVGEIRDKETASLAINAALTGHLVLSTLHTNSAAGAIPRLLDMGVEPFLLASVLRVVVGQRLVRVLCSKKEEYNLSISEINGLDKMMDMGAVLKNLKDDKIIPANFTWKNITLSREKPNEECVDGYKGRKGISEVLPITATIRELILKSSISDEIEKTAKKEGMLTMLEDGLYKCAQGITSIEEVLRVVAE